MKDTFFFATPLFHRCRADATTLAPVSANIAINGLTFNLGETKQSNPANGRYHLWLPNGNYTLTVTPDNGGSARQVTITADEDGIVRDIFV